MRRQAARTGGGVGRDEQRGLAEGEVGDEGGDAVPEEAGVTEPRGPPVPLAGDDVERRPAPTRVRAVHDVVLDEGEEVQQLEGCGDAHQVRVRLALPTGESPAPVGQDRPQALAVVPGALGELANEVDAQRPGFRVAARRGPLDGGAKEGVRELDEGRLEQDVGLGEGVLR